MEHSWTAGGDYNQAGSTGFAIAGVQTAAIGFADMDLQEVLLLQMQVLTMEACWTENYIRRDYCTRRIGSGPHKEQRQMLWLVGNRPGNTEKWNGTSWTEVANMGSGRNSPFSAGNWSWNRKSYYCRRDRSLALRI